MAVGKRQRAEAEYNGVMDDCLPGGRQGRLNDWMDACLVSRLTVYLPLEDRALKQTVILVGRFFGG